MTRSEPQAPAVEIDAGLARAQLGARRIGPHLALAAGLRRAAERAERVGASTVQVFADAPAGWRRRDGAHRGVDVFRRRLEDLDIGPVAVHGPYLVNLAAPDAALRDRSVTVVVDQLRAAARFGARFLNVHIGSHRGSGVDAGIRWAGEGVVRALEATDTTDGPILVLEDSAGQGDSVGVTLDELGEIAGAAVAAGADPARFGFCLDTAHLWAAGYALDDPEAVDDLLAGLDGSMAPGRLVMLHLNDSRTERGSRTDRHEHLGAGRIGPAGLGHVLRHPRLRDVPMYLETPGLESGWDAVEMAWIRSALGATGARPTPA